MPDADIQVEMIDGPLPEPAPATAEGAGCTVRFEGIVRPTETGRPLTALDYTAYQPMALRQLGQLAEQTSEAHRLLLLHVEHSRGRVPVGACSFRLLIGAEHRKEALAAMDAFIDTMKRDVPIWKSPVFADVKEGALR